MSTPAEPLAEPLVRDEPIPREARETICTLAFAAASANVVMQLAQLPIGRAVALSTVDSGRVDKHPLKRFRTTSAYLAVAMLGTPEDRLGMRREVNRQHRQVKSKAPVPYNAFDPQLPLWAAACLYKGLEDIDRLVYGPPSPERRDVLYHHSRRLGTTLQMPEALWPADHAAFERYWAAGLETIEMDDVSRPYLQGIAKLRFAGPLGRPLAPLGEVLTVGFLPPPFRDELGLPWNRRRQRAFDALVLPAAAVTRRAPEWLRHVPFNLFLADTRKRIREGRPIV